MAEEVKKAFMLAPMASVFERFSMANFNALKTLGCEIHVAANFDSNEHDREYALRLEGDGVVVHNIPFVRGSLFGNLKHLPEIRGILRAGDFDLVHCHTETGGILMRLAMAKNGRTKYVFTPHGMSFYKGGPLKGQLIYRPIERWICAAMDANLAMNEEELEVLQGWNRATAKFIHGIGVSLESIQELDVDVAAKKAELGIPADALVVMSVGELNSNKNHTVVLDAIGKLKDTANIYYLICGRGELRETLMEQAKDLGFADRLILPGYRYDMAEIFHVGDIFVFPSFHEGLSVALMQSMIAGMPVICSKIRGNVDLIKDGKNGFLFSPKDSEALSVALQTLLDNQPQRKAMGDLNKKIINGYSQQTVEKETYDIYNGLLSRYE